MHPELGEAFGVTVYSYGTCIFLAAPVCLLVLAILLRRRNLNPAPAVDLAVIALIGYWLGARLLYRMISGTPGSATGTGAWGGQIVFGALSLACVAFARAPRRDLLDALAVAWAFLTVPVKIGCFLAGCCHGAPTDLPWAVNRIHPTQLYDAVSAACIGAGLAVAYQRRLGRGRLFLVFLVAYSVTKFTSEVFRGDHRFSVAGVLTASMVIEAATAILGAAMLLRPGLWERGLDALERRVPAESGEEPLALRERARIFVLELGQVAIAVLVAVGAGAGRRWPPRAMVAYFAAFVALQFLLGRLNRFKLLDRKGAAAPAVRRITRGLVQALGAFTVVAVVRPLLDRRGRTLGDAVAETVPAPAVLTASPVPGRR